jgi:hypothetical protein
MQRRIKIEFLATISPPHPQLRDPAKKFPTEKKNKKILEKH